MKKKLSNIILVIAFFIGLSLLLYPTISDYWNSFHQSRAIAAYTDEVANLDNTSYEKIWKSAKEYNKKLLDKTNRMVLSEEEEEEYEQELNVGGNGIMAYIDIPAINCSLPIYHGVDEAVLQIAVGHIAGTSLPVGGKSTHCVVSGHRGLPSAKLFTNLDQLTEGDVFLVQVLDETLTYEVDQILIVEPDDVSALEIEEGKDYFTLVTCTPYAINSHRLLVRGHRIATEIQEGEVRINADARQIDPVLVAPFLAIPVLLILLIMLFVMGRRH
ncbi:MAG: class C sortase [Eubacteriales bacterium]|nr:class C sortase [Eubacteriales bacterium]